MVMLLEEFIANLRKIFKKETQPKLSSLMSHTISPIAVKDNDLSSIELEGEIFTLPSVLAQSEVGGQSLIVLSNNNAEKFLLVRRHNHNDCDEPYFSYDAVIMLADEFLALDATIDQKDPLKVAVTFLDHFFGTTFTASFFPLSE